LLNHDIYSKGSKYPNNWSFELNKYLMNVLDVKDNNVLPLANFGKTFVNEKYVSHVMNKKINKINRQINELQIKLDKLSNSVYNIFDEHDDTIRNNDRGNIYKVNDLEHVNDVLRDDIIDVRDKIRDYQNQLVILNNQSTQEHDYVDRNMNAKFDNMTFTSDKNIVDMYESIFVKIINGNSDGLSRKIYSYDVDFKTYPLLVNNFMNYYKQGSLIDYTQILQIISLFQNSIIKSDRDILFKINNLRIVQDYYKNVVKSYADDYFDLANEYDTDNIQMNAIIDILVHITKRIICPNIFSTIVRAITEHVISELPYDQALYGSEDNHISIITHTILFVINDDGETANGDRGPVVGSRLLKHIFEYMPLIIVKSITGIYQGPDNGLNDPDKSETLQSLFGHINIILGSVATLNLTPDKPLLKNLKEYVYPFYENYLELFIKEMFNLMSNYLRSLQYQCKMLNILHIIASHAVNEKKIHDETNNVDDDEYVNFNKTAEINSELQNL